MEGLISTEPTKSIKKKMYIYPHWHRCSVLSKLALYCKSKSVLFCSVTPHIRRDPMN